MTQPPTPLPPVRKSLRVRATPAAAFRRFTDEIATWWPLRTHSVGQRDAVSVAFEGRVGGRIVERVRDGRECVWGTVLHWDPPNGVAFTWHPGRELRTAQQVELRFIPEGADTRVELVHTGWEQLGRIGRLARRGYNVGWNYVLAFYTGRRGAGWMVLHVLTLLLALPARLRRAV